MSELPSRFSLAPEVFREVDRVCQAFETAWKSGAPPQPGLFMTDVVEPVRSALLRELVLLDVEYRQKQGQTPHVEDYLAQFPEATSLLRTLWQSLELEAKAGMANAFVMSPQSMPAETPGQPVDGSAAATSPWGPAPADGTQRSRSDPESLPQFLGRFQIRSRLGSGGFGTVYRAYDPLLDREVALKIPHSQQLRTDSDRSRVLREAKAAGQLRHPNIVPVYEAGEAGELFFIASAYIAGQTLAERLAAEAFDARAAARLVMALAYAIDYAHRQTIIHRDVKPGNILLDASGDPLLTDFGLARFLESDEQLTQDGVAVGTPAYMSPEQARGEMQTLGPATDQYSLGVVLYELLCGRRPFEGPAARVLADVIDKEPVSPRAVRSTVPRDLETICLKAMSKVASQRYPSCSELGDDLRRWLEGEPIRARHIGPMERLARWCRRNRVVAGLSVATALLLFLVAVVATWGYVRTSKALARESDERHRAEDATLREKEERRRATAEAERANLAAHKEALARQSAEAVSYRHAIALAQAYLDRNDPFQADATLDKCPARLRHWEWGYLKKACGQPLVITAEDEIYLGAFTPDHKLIATASRSGDIRIWDASTGRPLPMAREIRDLVPTVENTKRHIADMHRAWIGNAHALSPDARRMAFSLDPSGTATRISQERTGPGPELSREIRVVDTASGKTVFTLRGHADTVVAIVYSPDGKWLASGAMDGEVILWDAERGVKVRVLRGHAATLDRILFSPDGKWLAAEWQDRRQVLWQVAKGQQVRVLREPPTDPTDPGHRSRRYPDRGSMQFSPNGRRLATVLHRHTGCPQLKIRDVDTGKELANLDFKVLYVSISFGAWSPDSSRVALVTSFAAQTGVEIRVLGGEQLETLFTLTPKPGEPDFGSSIAFSPDGKLLAVGKYNGEIALYHAKTGKELRIDKIHDKEVNGLAFSPDGRRIASAGDSTVRVWDVFPNPQQGREFSCADVDGLGFLSNDGTLIVAHFSGVVYNVQTGQEVATLREYAESPCIYWSGVFSADNRKFIARCRGDVVKIWDVASGEVVFRIPSVRRLCGFSPDLRRVAVISGPPPVPRGEQTVGRNRQLAKHKLEVYDTTTGKPWELLLEPTKVRSIRTDSGEAFVTTRPTLPFGPVWFSPSGDELYFCIWDKEQGTWNACDARSGALRRSVPAGCVECQAMSPDGSQVCLGGVSTVYTSLDTATGRERFTLRGSRGLVRSVVYSPDGQRIATFSVDGTIRLWDAMSGEQLLPIPALPPGELQWGQLFHLHFVGAKGEKLVATIGRPEHAPEIRVWDSGVMATAAAKGGIGVNEVSTVAAPAPLAAAWPADSPVPRPGAPAAAITPFDEKKAKEHQKAWAKHLGGTAELSNSIGMKFVLIPPGEFLMGSSLELVEEESRGHADDPWYLDHLRGERPQHRVRITRPFWLATCEVTREQYERTTGSSPSKQFASSSTSQANAEGQAESRVSWDEAVEFCRRLSQLPEEKAAGRQYHLPTEAQWEYACRSGSTTRYSFGDDESSLGDYASFRKNPDISVRPKILLSVTGKHRPNSWGLFDMHGNVWEWCQDVYDNDYYAKSPRDDPPGPRNGSRHVLRGGCQFSSAWSCRSANRADHESGFRSGNAGFRVRLEIHATRSAPPGK